jgi:hypothetical protein
LRQGEEQPQMPATAALFQQAREPICLHRLLHKAQVVNAIWRIGIDADPATLVQLVARGKRERLFALQMSEQCQAIQSLEHPPIGAIFLLASIGLTTGEEPPFPFQ